jgi:hypothetical protein
LSEDSDRSVIRGLTNIETSLSGPGYLISIASRASVAFATLKCLQPVQVQISKREILQT